MALLAFAPTALAGEWTVRQLSVGSPEQSRLNGVSCPSKSLCVAAGESDAIASSTNPTGGAGEWHVVRPYDAASESETKCYSPPPGPPTEVPCPEPPLYRQLRAISCPSSNLCVAVTYDGYVYTSTDPSGPAASWQVADVDGEGRDTHLESVSCPNASLCVAVSGNRYTSGKVLSSTDPSGGAGAWKTVQLDETLDLRGVSCASPSFCLAVGQEGRMVASDNPTGGAGEWRELTAPGAPENLEGVSCLGAASVFCVVGEQNGNLLSSNSPGSGGWQSVNGGGSILIRSVDCISAAACVAVDDNGSVLTSTKPAGGPGSWSFQNLVPYVEQEEGKAVLNALFGVSCPSTSLCVLAGANGFLLTSTDPFSAPGPPPIARPHRRHRKGPRTILTRARGFHNLTVTPRRRFRGRFRFHAIGRAKRFICKRDRHPYRRCRSPLRYWVPVGRHVLRVRAIGPTGRRGPVAFDRFIGVHPPEVR
jgi:hypothetical protein